MKQRIIWTIALVIGVLLSASSCKKHIDYLHYEEYHYINNSNRIITITAFYKIDTNWLAKTYNIGLNERFFQETELFAGSRTDVIGLCDSVVVTYENERESFFVVDSVSPYNILRHDNYAVVKISDIRNASTYTFTENDYENAIPIGK